MMLLLMYSVARYSTVEAGGGLYGVELNHGEVDVVSSDGSISRLLDVSATQGHLVHFHRRSRRQLLPRKPG